MNDISYNRICYVDIGGGLPLEELQKNGWDNIDWERISGLDIKFNVEQYAASSEAKAKISICGLSFDRIVQLASWASEATTQSKCWLIRLYAGYGASEDDVDMIFEGEILNAMPTSPPDVWLNIEARSHYAHRVQYFTADLKDMTNAENRYVDVATCLDNLCYIIHAYSNIGEDDEYMKDILSKKVCFPVHETPVNMMTIVSDIQKICQDTGLTYVIKRQPDGLEKYIFSPLEYPSGFVPSVSIWISPQTGMIGIPKMTMQGIEVTCLLSNTLKDMTLGFFGVESRFAMPGMFGQQPGYQRKGWDDIFRCIYRVIIVKYHGHLRGNDWYVTYYGMRFIEGTN